MLRGEVYRLRLPKGLAHEQRGQRYGVVVQADVLLPSSTVLLVPSSRSVKPASFRPEAQIASQRTRLLPEQLGAFATERLGKLVGRLSAEELWSLDDALLLVLDLKV